MQDLFGEDGQFPNADVTELNDLSRFATSVHLEPDEAGRGISLEVFRDRVVGQLLSIQPELQVHVETRAAHPQVVPFAPLVMSLAGLVFLEIAV